VKLSIVSTTVQTRVREEAAVLGIDGFFEGRIWGSGSDTLQLSKRGVFARLLAEESIPPGGFLAFGDGPAELQAARELGGIAVGVCTREDTNGGGTVDADKHHQLAAAGAHFLIPDYRDAATILNWFTQPIIP
jgi:methionine salvage enolase-phosphatase E1